MAFLALLTRSKYVGFDPHQPGPFRWDLTPLKPVQVRGTGHRTQERAGFAAVLQDEFGKETKKAVQNFTKYSIKQSAKLITDGKPMYKNLGHEHEYSPNLKWVNRFISNSKTWILGTHHGLRNPEKYLKYYMAEYTFRFNRRHDPNSLFHRALNAMVQAKPLTLHALTG